MLAVRIGHTWGALGEGEVYTMSPVVGREHVREVNASLLIYSPRDPKKSPLEVMYSGREVR